MKIIKAKVWTLLVALTISLPLFASAAAPEIESWPLYAGRELSLDGFVGVGTTDFDDESAFVGFGVNYFLDENFGAGVSTSFGDMNNEFFENISVKGLYRFTARKTAPYLFAGSLYSFEIDEWGLTLGVGVEHRFTSHLGAFVEIGMEKYLDHHDAVAIGKVGIRIPLSLQKSH